MKSSGIGGQAVIEGVMMKNRDKYAIAVRKPDNEIVVENREYQSISEKYKIFKLPILRGVAAFAESMSIGMKTLTFSASFYEEEEEAKPSKMESAFQKLFKGKAESVLMGITVVIAMLAAIGIFMILPWYLTELLGKKIQGTLMAAAMEGVMRLMIFIIYVFAISLTKDIRRVYMYHGAEHKTINCVEHGYDLTVENVRKQSKEHKRCGTSFMLYVMVLSILFFMFIRVDNPGLRVLFRVLLIPVIAGVSYEFIRFAGNSESVIMSVLSKPGLWLQGLTTREPDDSMIEVAIRSVEAVFDWKAYLQENQAEISNKRALEVLAEKEAKAVEASEEIENEEKEEDDELLAALDKSFDEIDEEALEQNVKKQQEEISKVAVAATADKSVRRIVTPTVEKLDFEPTVGKVAAVKKASGTRQPMRPIEEVRRENVMLDVDEEDEVLSALDKFFVETESEDAEQ